MVRFSAAKGRRTGDCSAGPRRKRVLISTNRYQGRSPAQRNDSDPGLRDLGRFTITDASARLASAQPAPDLDPAPPQPPAAGQEAGSAAPARRGRSGALRTLGPAFPLAERTGYLLFRAGHLLMREAEAELARLRLTSRAYLVLAAVAGPGSTSQQDLSVLFGIDPGTIVALVDDLEDRGLLVRRRKPADRRRYELALTAKGRRLAAEAAVAVAAAEERFLGRLDQRERASLQRMLGRVLDEHWPEVFRTTEP